MGSDLITVLCRLSRCIPNQRGRVSPRRDPARLGLCQPMWTQSEPLAPLVRLLILCILPVDILLHCSHADPALLISSWNVVMLHLLQGSLNPIEIHKPQQEACKSDFPVYKQADLCESVEVCSSGLAPTLQMCYFSCHLCAARGEKCHYSSSDVACNVCGVTCHSKAPQPA